jgi:hypothetical protein
MPKRYLTIQNKENEHEQPQSSSIITRSSSKRASTNESIPAKKAKIDKENIPEDQSNEFEQDLSPSKDQNNQSSESESDISPSQNLILPILNALLNNNTNDSDDEFDDDEGEENPISSVADQDNGKDHPTNKQYLIYENGDSNKEPYIISKTARYWSLKYRKVLRHVNPDAYGMYIHNDFSCYGELEVVENCLRDLTKTIFIVQQNVLNRSNYIRKPDDKVNYILGFRRLEVLTILLDYTDGISGIDDGDRFYDIMRVIGACYVTILRGLLPKIMFDKIENIDENLIKKLNKISKQLPNLKQVLEQALIIGYNFLTIADVCSAYTKILQIVYCNWVLIMDKISIDLNQQSNQLNPNLWKALKHASLINPNEIEHGGKESFDFIKELRIYKGQHGLGGDSYDLSKWSRSDRAAYKLGRRNPFQGFWFF